MHFLSIGRGLAGTDNALYERHQLIPRGGHASPLRLPAQQTQHGMGNRPRSACRQPAFCGDNVTKQPAVLQFQLFDLQQLLCVQVHGFPRQQHQFVGVGLAIRHEGLHKARQAFTGGTGTFEALSGFIQQVGQARLDQLEQQRLFALDVVVQRAGAQAQVAGQVTQADGLVAMAGKQGAGRIQQAVPSVRGGDGREAGSGHASTCRRIDV